MVARSLIPYYFSREWYHILVPVDPKLQKYETISDWLLQTHKSIEDWLIKNTNEGWDYTFTNKKLIYYFRSKDDAAKFALFCPMQFSD